MNAQRQGMPCIIERVHKIICDPRPFFVHLHKILYMRGLNKVLLIGNLGKDPDVQVFESGTKKAAFSLATTERYRDRNGVDQSVTEWHNIVVWGPQADVVEKYLKKGAPIYLEGKIRTREYEASDGQKRRITEVIANNFLMLGGRPDGEFNQTPAADINAASNENVPSNDSPLDDPKDDLPF